MKNIFKIMEEFGLEISEEKRKDFEKAVNENYKTVADYDKQKEKLQTAEDTIKENDEAIKDLKKELDGFKDVDVSALKNRIEELEENNGQLKADYEAKIAERDFNDVVREGITEAKGRNVKAIMALLDTETLKASKNQKEDIKSAIQALVEAEDSKMLFGESEPQVAKTGNIIGKVGGSGIDVEDAQMRAVMGLPPVTGTEQK